VSALTPLDAVTRHVRLLVRAETLILEVRLRALAQQSLLFATAGVIAAIGLAMLNVAAYVALEPLWGGLWTALAMAAADFIVAAVLAFVATRNPKAADLDMANQLRDQALETLALDARMAAFAGSASMVVLPMILGLIRRFRKPKED
jgi:hypothetical protein